MTLEVIDFFLFCNIIDFDLSIAVAESDLVIITKRHRTDVIIDLIGFVETMDVGGAAGPDVECGIKSDSYLVVIGPVDKVEVEVVLEVGSF